MFTDRRDPHPRLGDTLRSCLRQIYDEKTSNALSLDILALVNRYGPNPQPAVVRLPDQLDVMLITYADAIRSAGKKTIGRPQGIPR